MWVIPSLNRPERLAQTLAALRSVGVSTPGLVMVGPDDALPEGLPDGWKAMKRDPADSRMPAALNRAFAMFPQEKWFGMMGDDTLVHTPGWDVKLIDAAGTKGMSCGNDDWQFHNGRMTGACCFGAELLKAFGFWHPPFLKHTYGDDFWEGIGRQFGNLKRLKHVRFTHHTPFNGSAERDATFKLAYGCMDEDRVAWMAWRESQDYRDLLDRVALLLKKPDEGNHVESDRMRRARSRSVLLCVPVARTPAWQFTLAFAETCVMLDRLGITFAIRFMVGSSNLPRARNELCARFLASGYTDMVFIDDDMGWKPEAVLRLLASEHEVIAGVGRKRVDKPNTDQDVWCVKFHDGSNKHINQDEAGAVEVHRVGTGFMKIARTALEKMIAAHPEWKRKGNSGMAASVKANYYQFFRFDPDDAFEMGEDYVFCERWIELGGKVWIDPEIHLSHVGEKEYSGAIAEMMIEAQEPQREAAE